MQKVIVLNRKQAIELTENDFSLNRVIISIHSIGDDKPKFNKNNHSIQDILHLAFNDWDDAKPDCMNRLDAIAVADFVNQYWNKVDQIVVHCDGGVSRSAGVAAAILRHFTDNDDQIFDNPKYCPNVLCYRLVLDALEEYENGVCNSCL